MFVRSHAQCAVCCGNQPFSRCDAVKVATQTPVTPSLRAVQSGGASHVQPQGLPASSYQTLPPGRADREDGVYFNAGTSWLERWSRTKKACVCLCNPTQSLACIGNLSFARCGVGKTVIKNPTVSLDNPSETQLSSISSYFGHSKYGVA